MNILVVSTFSPEKSVGGIERYLLNFIAYSKKYSHDHTYFLLPTSDNKTLLDGPNTSILRHHSLTLKATKIFGERKVSSITAEKQAKEFYSYLNQTIKDLNIKVIEAESFEYVPYVFNLYLHLACINNQIPVCNRVHIFPPAETQVSILRDLPWSKVLPVSLSVAGDLLHKGINIEKIQTIYPGVNREEFNRKNSRKWLKQNLKLSEDSKIILHASRITSPKRPILKDKGIITLIEAFSKIYQDFPNYKLVIAAAYPGRTFAQEYDNSLSQLLAYANIHGLSDRIICKRFNFRQMPKVYAGADIFVMASENETFGQVFTEAMAAGTPVIGTNVGGIPEIISENKTGFLIEPGNSSQLAQQIARSINDTSNTKIISKNATNLINKQLSSKKQFTRLLDLFHQISKSN